MNLEEAKEVLNRCKRMELRDHAFGDMEVWWINDNKIDIASGYFSCSSSQVTILSSTHFEDDDARELAECGTLDEVWRNDKTGPDMFVVGTVMPGLTKEGVLEELTRSEDRP